VSDEVQDRIADAPASYGVGGRAILENRFVADDDLEHDPRVAAMFGGRPLRRAMAAPVHDRGKAIGSVAVGSFESRAYTPLDRELLEAFADYASLAVSDARRVAATRHQALHDDLTGLPNRALFLDRLEHALARCEQRGGEVAVLFCDVDHFKQVNDRLGHNIGDELLRAIAQRIIGCLRGADTAARLGGDEFAILLEDSTPAEAERVADRILATFRTGLVVRGRELPIAASLGVALSSHSTNPDDLLRYSDVAMYRAKAMGRGRYVVFDASMWSDVVSRAELESDLRRSVTHGEPQDLAVVYQPILDLATLDLVAVEALARWRHPQRGEIEPDLFVAVAEEAGLILDLGRAVLRKACTQLREWHDRLGLAVTVTVNVSAQQLDDSRLVDHIVSAINDSGIEPHQLMLEIKESVVMQDTGPNASERLLALKAIGVRIAVDGFGTGYSSLGYLKRLPVDALKIDKTLVHDVERSSRDLALVRTVVSLGETLGLDMIAEGIETVAQLKALRRIGCGQGQGFHLCAPMTAAELERILPGSFGQPMQVPSPR
jgi:diguanylate cyclase (GGDEF)-like protein